MHVPDEWLNIGYAEQVTAAIARAFSTRTRGNLRS